MILTDDQNRVQQVTVQYNPSTQKHYLATSFTAGYQSGAEVLYYLDELETGTWVGEFTGTGNTGWVPTYTTITLDQDFDINATATSFLTTSTPFSVHFEWIGFQGTPGYPAGLPEANFAASGSSPYTGTFNCPTATGTGSPTPTASPSATPTPAPVLQRWGDYNSFIWDPSMTSSNGEQGLFWNVAEFSNGGSDQSTQWTQFNDPLPYYVNYSAAEGECEVPPGVNCSVTVNAPANLQNGDVVIAFVDMGGQFPVPPTPPDGTWVSLPIANMNNATSMQSGRCSRSDLMTEYAYAHVFGASVENGPYLFKHIDEHYCSGNNAPEMEAFLVGYRAANINTAGYVLYGYPAASISSTVTVGPATGNSPSTGALLNVFYGSGFENNDSGEYGQTTFSSPTGTPTAAAETPLTPSNTAYFLADLGIPNTNTALGQYSVSTCTGAPPLCQNTFTKFGWQLFVPEP